jgi:hypothetical protein
MDESTLDHQAAIAVTALAAALCKQRGINGDQLRLDLLEMLEGIAGSPQGVETVGKQTANLMDSILQAGRGKS